MNNHETINKIYANVYLGTDSQIDDFVIVGRPPKDKKAGELETLIGRHAIIRSHTVIYAGNLIGDFFQTGHGVMIREENTIGDRVSVGTHSVIEHHVKISNRVRLHSNVFVPEFSTIEEGAWIGPNVVLTNAKYPLSPEAKNQLIGPHIHKNAKIGANATILPGVTIGENALVGAGSVVVKDVPMNAVVVGNPAQIIGKVTDLNAYRTNKLLE